MSGASSDVVSQVENWVATAIPEFSTITGKAKQLDTPLPIVVAAIDHFSQEDAEQALPGFGAYQQLLVRAWTIRVLLLVDPDLEDVDTTLYSYVDTLADKLASKVRVADNTVLSQYFTASYDPPELEYGDGTKARAVTVIVTAGETKGA